MHATTPRPRATQNQAELKTQAEQDQQTYDGLNYRDDQVDLSDAALATAIGLLSWEESPAVVVATLAPTGGDALH